MSAQSASAPRPSSGPRGSWNIGLRSAVDVAVGNRNPTATALTRKSPAEVASKCTRGAAPALIANAAPAAPARPPALKSPWKVDMMALPMRCSIEMAWAFIANGAEQGKGESERREAGRQDRQRCREHNGKNRRGRRCAAAEAGGQGTADWKPDQRSGGHRQQGKAEDAVGESECVLGIRDVGDPATKRGAVGKEDPGRSETRPRHAVERDFGRERHRLTRPSTAVARRNVWHAPAATRLRAHRRSTRLVPARRAAYAAGRHRRFR